MLSSFLDPSIVHPNPTEATNLEPLLINTAGSWSDRPEAASDRVDNFLLASDYVRTNTDLATMEGANEAARRAVNGILERSGSRAERCQVWKLREPVLFAPFRALDKVLFKLGRPPRPADPSPRGRVEARAPDGIQRAACAALLLTGLPVRRSCPSQGPAPRSGSPSPCGPAIRSGAKVLLAWGSSTLERGACAVRGSRASGQPPRGEPGAHETERDDQHHGRRRQSEREQRARPQEPERDGGDCHEQDQNPPRSLCPARQATPEAVKAPRYDGRDGDARP